MNEVKATMLYLAGPIDGVDSQEARGWRAEVGAMVDGSAVLLFDPSTAWHGTGEFTAKSLDYFNRHMISLCDGVLANLSGTGRGFGTIREIEFGRLHDKPVAVVTGDEPLESLLQHDLLTASTLEGGLEILLGKIADIRNQPPSIFGFPFGHVIRLSQPEEHDEEA